MLNAKNVIKMKKMSLKQQKYKKSIMLYTANDCYEMLTNIIFIAVTAPHKHTGISKKPFKNDLRHNLAAIAAPAVKLLK